MLQYRSKRYCEQRVKIRMETRGKKIPQNKRNIECGPRERPQKVKDEPSLNNPEVKMKEM